MPKSSSTTAAKELKGADPQVCELWTRAGARCEFHGCNEYLLEDELTTNSAKLANVAHIVARSVGGPRGGDPLPVSERNNISNLMLLCRKHHALIDDKKLEGQFPREILQEYKRDHEDRIRYLTGLGVEHETVVLRVVGNVRGDSVSISEEEIRTAVLDAGRYPRYLGSKHIFEIDLQGLPQNVDQEYWKSATAKVSEVVSQQVAPAIEGRKIGHLSIFALARIPILVYFGNLLGDKIATDFYQRHRDEPADWRWKKEDPAQFFLRETQTGTNAKRVALVVSLSGKIGREDLPPFIDESFYVYEIVPDGREPSRSLLATRETLTSFQRSYAQALRKIEAEHGKDSELHLFAAVPAPVAVICGRELMKGVSPKMYIYDKLDDGYGLALTVN